MVSRLTTIETLLNRLIAQSSAPIPSALPAQVSIDPSLPVPDISSLQPSGEEIFHPRSTPPAGLRPSFPNKPPPSGLFPSNLSHTAPSSRTGFGWGLREGRLINLLPEENAELQDILQTLKESGITKGHLEWLIAGVPGRRMADSLVELYFKDIE